MSQHRVGALAVLALLALVAGAPAASAQQDVVETGALRATVQREPLAITFTGPAGQARVDLRALQLRTAGLEFAARDVREARRDGDAVVLDLATTHPLGHRLVVRVAPAGDGIVAVRAHVPGEPADVQAVQARFGATHGERYVGFGERSNAVDQRGRELENYVADGPYQPLEDGPIIAFVPLPGYRPRPDATYFPIPWLLSTRGYGVLVDDDETPVFDLRAGQESWTVRTAAPHLSLRVFAGPQPADVLRRYTAAEGRQPAPSAPFVLGPWFQPYGVDVDLVRKLREAGAAASVAQTYTHYLPCGDQRTQRERDRTARLHALGLAVTTYFNPMICTTHRRAFERAAANGWLTKDPGGQAYTYRYTGTTTFFVGQVDFTAPGAAAFYGDLLHEAVEDGYDGWMEDFGEYTPLDARAHDGSTGEAGHNRYVVGYHRAAHDYSRGPRPARPLARFQRSGWRGSPKHAEIVWGGDPSTGWGFDGLRSAITQGLTMGLSGVSLWGSDIGGFFALSLPQTTPELLQRWIQVGFASGVMRTQANGFELLPSPRAQIGDAGVLPVWARYSRLRTQLFPYLDAAQAEYRRSGLPLMRHLALAHPGDPRAVGTDDAYLLGPDLLVAPVLDEGARRRSAYLPVGEWVDVWRSVRVGKRAALRPTAPRLLRGGRTVEVPAPVEELPLFARAGTILPLLPDDVDTLAEYGAGEVVRLADRASRRVLLAFPRGRSEAALGRGTRHRVVSAEKREGWVLRFRAPRTTRYELRASLRTLRRPFRPRCVRVGGRRLPREAWSYDGRTGALTARLRLRSERVVIARRCG